MNDKTYEEQLAERIEAGRQAMAERNQLILKLHLDEKLGYRKLANRFNMTYANCQQIIKRELRKITDPARKD